jgi:hypothetical protein
MGRAVCQVRLGSLPEPLDDLERFLSMLWFDSREKSKDLPFDQGVRRFVF